MATHSSILSWTITGTEDPGELPSMGSHRVGHDWSDLAAAARRVSIFPTLALEHCIFRMRWEQSGLSIIKPLCSPRPIHAGSACYTWSEVKSLSRVRPFATPWTVAYQDPQSMGFSRQEHWATMTSHEIQMLLYHFCYFLQCLHSCLSSSCIM